MECIIHYTDLNEEDLSKVTVKTSKTIVSAKELHQNENDKHLTQCTSIPTDETSRCNSYYHKSCYNRFVKIVSRKPEKNEKNTNSKKPVGAQPEATLITRSKSKRKQKLKGLSPRKRQRLTSPTPESDSYRLRSASLPCSS